MRLAIAISPDRAHGQRALADAADHHLPAGLDALGDGDLALAREQLDVTHLPQVHPDGIVGAAEFALVHVAGGRLGVGDVGLGGRRCLVLLLGLDHADADLGQHRHGVLDLLRRHLFGRKRRVQLVIGDVTTLLAAGDHPLDAGAQRVQERAVGLFVLRVRHFGDALRFYRHLSPAADIHQRERGRRRRAAGQRTIIAPTNWSRSASGSGSAARPGRGTCTASGGATCTTTLKQRSVAGRRQCSFTPQRSVYPGTTRDGRDRRRRRTPSHTPLRTARLPISR